MRLYTVKAFEGQVVTTSIATKSRTYTPPQYEAMFGAAESFALELSLSDVLGSGVTLSVDYFWSNNGTIWYAAGAGIMTASDTNLNTGFLFVPTGNGALGKFGFSWSAVTQGSASFTVCGRAQQSWM